MATKVIESNFDNFKVERTFVGVDAPGGDPRDLSARALVSGVECRLDGKPSHLAAGIAFCQPVDPRLAENWPLSVTAEIEGVRQYCPNMTDEPRIVAAVRKFQRLVAAGEAKTGMEL